MLGMLGCWDVVVVVVVVAVVGKVVESIISQLSKNIRNWVKLLTTLRQRFTILSRADPKKP